MDIKTECLALLQQEGINPSSSIDFKVNDTLHSLSLESIIESYMQASVESQLVFLRSLQKATEVKALGIEKFFEGMGQLLLMTQLSEKFGVE